MEARLNGEGRRQELEDATAGAAAVAEMAAETRGGGVTRRAVAAAPLVAAALIPQSQPRRVAAGGLIASVEKVERKCGSSLLVPAKEFSPLDCGFFLSSSALSPLTFFPFQAKVRSPLLTLSSATLAPDVLLSPQQCCSGAWHLLEWSSDDDGARRRCSCFSAAPIHQGIRWRRRRLLRRRRRRRRPDSFFLFLASERRCLRPLFRQRRRRRRRLRLLRWRRGRRSLFFRCSSVLGLLRRGGRHLAGRPRARRGRDGQARNQEEGRKRQRQQGRRQRSPEGAVYRRRCDPARGAAGGRGRGPRGLPGQDSLKEERNEVERKKERGKERGEGETRALSCSPCLCFSSPFSFLFVFPSR